MRLHLRQWEVHRAFELRPLPGTSHPWTLPHGHPPDQSFSRKAWFSTPTHLPPTGIFAHAVPYPRMPSSPFRTLQGGSITPSYLSQSLTKNQLGTPGREGGGGCPTPIIRKQPHLPEPCDRRGLGGTLTWTPTLSGLSPAPGAQQPDPLQEEEAWGPLIQQRVPEIPEGQPTRVLLSGPDRTSRVPSILRQQQPLIRQQI